MIRSSCTLALVALTACTGGAKDVSARRDRDSGASELDSGVPPVPTKPTSTARWDAAAPRPKIVVHASSRSLAVDRERLYYGDADDDTLYAVAKTGGDPVRLARRAPVAGTLAQGGDLLAWIATPGDVVFALHLPVAKDAQPTTLRDKGLFADVAVAGGDVFIADVSGSGGTIVRTSGGAATVLAKLDAAPRAIVVDAERCYVVTAQKLLAVPRTKGDVQTLATGVGLEEPAIDDANVYVIGLETDAGTSRALYRVPKAGGDKTAIASGVRRAPIAAADGEVYFFDGERSRVLAVSAKGGTPRSLGWDDALARPNAIAVDETTVYVATGEREDGAVFALSRR